MFLSAFQYEPIVTDNRTSEEDNQEVTQRKETAGEEHVADQASEFANTANTVRMVTFSSKH